LKNYIALYHNSSDTTPYISFHIEGMQGGLDCFMLSCFSAFDVLLPYSGALRNGQRLLCGILLDTHCTITQMRINIPQASNHCLIIIALYFSSQLLIKLVLYQSTWPQTHPLKMDCWDNSWKNWKM